MLNNPPGIIWNVYSGPTMLGIVNESTYRAAMIAAEWAFVLKGVRIVEATLDPFRDGVLPVSLADLEPDPGVIH